MFTGVIKKVIRLERIKNCSNNMTLHLPLPFSANIGDSVSVNGACLTIFKITGKTYMFDVSSETVKRSNLSRLHAGDWVNIEPSLATSDLLHGHIVYGHVDGIGKILNIKKRFDSSDFIIEFPPGLSSLIAEKGSVALDGISLTITGIKKNSFKVVLIKHTLSNTNFQYKKRGDTVNIEVDPLTRYLQRYREVK
jgi:riboflavin synthase